MGWYERHLLPRLVDKVCGTREIRQYRAEAVEGLRGEVVEIGFGSGLNLPLLPDTVTKVLAVDPSVVGQRLARERLARSPVPVEVVGLDGSSLPVADASVDAALSTFTLCTIPDVELALAEVRRVLRPGGRFQFLEHGLCPDPRVARWQHRLTPLQRRIAGGCHFDRPIADLVASSGLEIETIRNAALKGPRTTGYLYIGTARRPAEAGDGGGGASPG